MVKNLALLPDLGKDYRPKELFLNQYGKDHPGRVGCKYQGISEEEQYLVIVESFQQIPHIDYLYSENYNPAGAFLFGYIPDFPPAIKCMDSGHTLVSIVKEREVFTFINMTPPDSKTNPDYPELNGGLYSFKRCKKDEKLKEFARKFFKETKILGYLPIYRLFSYLPQKSPDGWKLVTIFCFYSFQDPNKAHLISNLQGNYEKEKKYLNLKLKFIYKMSEGKVYLGPRGTEIKGSEIKIWRYTENQLLELSSVNEKENFLVSVSNNETTLDHLTVEPSLKRLMMAALHLLNSYSCVEKTLCFIEDSSKLGLSSQNCAE